jgi:hypothetical protein
MSSVEVEVAGDDLEGKQLDDLITSQSTAARKMRRKVVKAQRPARLSENMKWVLQGICEGKPTDHGCYGRSEFAGRGQTLIALRDRGFLDKDHNPTSAALAMFPPADKTKP